MSRLVPGAPRSLWLILNPRAAADEVVREEVAFLRQVGHTVQVRVTWEAGQAAEFARDGDERGADVVVVAGGDGTINEVVNGLFAGGRTPTCVLGILPAGTANDFARANGLPVDDPAEALRLVATAEPVPLDVGRLNGRLFLNVASGGFAAEVTTSTPAEMKDVLGGFAYFLTGVANVASVTARPAHVRGPDFVWDGNLLGLAVGNGAQAGGGFRVTPHARLNDGLLDVLLIPEVGWQALFPFIQDMLTLEDPDDPEHAIYRQLAWLEVEAPEGLQINLDGEPMRDTFFRFDLAETRLPTIVANPAMIRDPA